MKKVMTLKDIAINSGFSIKTVSRALNNQPGVNKKTKEKIIKIAKKYSYYPNLLAKGLKQKKTFSIGYILTDISNEFYGNIGIAIEKTIKKHEYSLLVVFTEDDPNTEIEAIKILLNKQIDGIILSTCGLTGYFIRDIINNFKIPLVVIDNKVNGVKTNLVLHNNLKGSYLLTKHLIEHGHKNIACITGSLNRVCGRERLMGYKKALSEFNIESNSELVKISNWRIDGGYNATLQLLKNNPRKVSAIFVANSIMALGVYKAIVRSGLKIPDDVAVVAFDELAFVDFLNPSLTTLNKVDVKIGELASNMLLRKIENKNDENIETKIIDMKLCIRESCGCNKSVSI